MVRSDVALSNAFRTPPPKRRRVKSWPAGSDPSDQAGASHAPRAPSTGSRTKHRKSDGAGERLVALHQAAEKKARESAGESAGPSTQTRETEFDALDRKQRDKEYARYKRAANHADTPEEIKTMIKTFSKNKARSSLTALFKSWFVTKGDWKSTLVRVQYLRETATQNRELDGWMTFGQIKKHYGGDDEAEEIAAELTKRKRALGLFRRHPDMPDIEKATLFWVMEEMDQSKTETDATRFNADRSLEVDGDTLKDLGSE